MTQRNPYGMPGLESVRQASMDALSPHRGAAALQNNPAPEYMDEGTSGGVIDLTEGSDGSLAGRTGWNRQQVSTFRREPRFRTLTVQQITPGQFFSKPLGGIPLALQVLVRLTYGIGATSDITTIFDLPVNGVVHVPLCCHSLSAVVGACYTGLNSTTFATIFPNADALNNPRLVVVDPTQVNQAGFVTGPLKIAIGLQPAQSLAPSDFTLVTRKISVLLSNSGSDQVVIPVPNGAQGIQAVGPADMTATLNQEFLPFGHDVTTGRTAISNTSTPGLTPYVQLPPMTSSVTLASATGGMVTAIFYLGIG